MQSSRVFSLLCLAVCAAFGVFTGSTSAQIMMDAGSYSQNFDSLGSAGAAWTNNVTLPGWYASKSGVDSATYLAGAGTVMTGGLYSFGTNGVQSASDRALGSVASGSASPVAYGMRFYNNTVTAITNIAISYAGEQWRYGGSNANTLSFSYAVSDSPITNTYSAVTWTAFAPLNFVSGRDF